MLSVTHSILLHGAEIWADALKLQKIQKTHVSSAAKWHTQISLLQPHDFGVRGTYRGNNSSQSAGTGAETDLQEEGKSRESTITGIPGPYCGSSVAGKMGHETYFIQHIMERMERLWRETKEPQTWRD